MIIKATMRTLKRSLLKTLERMKRSLPTAKGVEGGCSLASLLLGLQVVNLARRMELKVLQPKKMEDPKMPEDYWQGCLYPIQ